MRTFALLIFGAAMLAGCTVNVRFPPHATTNRPFKAPITLGVYYTTGTLSRVEIYENKNVSWFKTWVIHTGEALEKEAFSRLRPRVERLVLTDSPYPDPRRKIDYVLSLGIEDFAWKNYRAETEVSVVLRGPGGAVLVDQVYHGAGSAKLQKVNAKEVTAAQGLGETTREAMSAALNEAMDDLSPYISPPGPTSGGG